MSDIDYYSSLEEKINISSHAFGFFLSIAALVLLVTRASTYGTVWHVVSFSVFGASLIILYAASTIYHSSKTQSFRTKMQVVDHASIYILIAGTYTPFALITLHGTTGWIIFGVTWGMAAVGVTLKLFFTGKYDLLSTFVYLFMGWIIVFAIDPLVDNISTEGLFWLVAGGIAYTVGAILYAIEKIKYNHAIFHAFVLLGSFCHFVSVYFYVLPIDSAV